MWQRPIRALADTGAMAFGEGRPGSASGVVRGPTIGAPVRRVAVIATAGLTSPGPGSNPTRNPTRELIAGHDRDHVLFSPQPVGPKKARRKLRSNSKS